MLLDLVLILPQYIHILILNKNNLSKHVLKESKSSNENLQPSVIHIKGITLNTFFIVLSSADESQEGLARDEPMPSTFRRGVLQPVSFNKYTECDC